MKRRDFVGALGSGLVGALTPGVRAGFPPIFRPMVRPYDRFIERWSWAMGQPVHLQLFAESESHGYDAAAAALARGRSSSGSIPMSRSIAGIHCCEPNSSS